MIKATGILPVAVERIYARGQSPAVYASCRAFRLSYGSAQGTAPCALKVGATGGRSRLTRYARYIERAQA